MKNLIDKIFKRDDTHDYVLAEYKPKKQRPSVKYAENLEYEVDQSSDKDEMEIDNLFSRN